MSSADFADDDLAGAARLELVDDAGRVVHALGIGPSVRATPADLARVTPAWRLRLFDYAGVLRVDLPARAWLSH